MTQNRIAKVSLSQVKLHDLGVIRVAELATRLSSWNLNYESFPDIGEFVRDNWTAPYGREQAEEYLSAVAAVRANSYWNVSPLQSTGDDKRLRYAISLFANVQRDLVGDRLITEVRV